MKKVALILLSVVLANLHLQTATVTEMSFHSNIFITTLQLMTRKERLRARVLLWNPAYLKIEASPLASTHTTQVAGSKRLI